MIIVFVPELESLLREARDLPPLLERFLARARNDDLDASAAGTELVLGQPVMTAPLTRRLDRPDDADGVWMRADPVELIPDLRAVWLRPGASLDPASRLVGDIKALVNEHGFEFDLPVAERGYLRLERVPDCRFTPPWKLAGESMEYSLPSGPDQKSWRLLLSEIQVLMHAHSASAGAPTGLWFWGAGELPCGQLPTTRVSHLSCGAPELIAAADWLDLSHEPPGATRPPADGSLVEWPAEPEQSADANLAALANFIAPLWRRLKLGRTDALELAGREQLWRVRPAAAWRFWQRSARA
ncbi:MAG: hypothetical protein V2J10_11145 [Wenzhouxiangella sp.]|nr:hypothetical protein [Wenzhouxiangella sp.]